VDGIAAERTSLTSSLYGIGLRPVAGLMEAHPMRWEIEDGVVLDILTPRRRGSEEAVLHLGVWAQALPFPEFSLKDPIDAVVLHREGVLSCVPAPKGCAVHKLIIASACTGSHWANSEMDLMQAAAFVLVLAEARFFELATGHEDAISRGPSWRRTNKASFARHSDIADLLTSAGD
jgi:hypothetical protein